MDWIEMGKTALELIVIPVVGGVVKLRDRVLKNESKVEGLQKSLDNLEKGQAQILDHLLEMKRG